MTRPGGTCVLKLPVAAESGLPTHVHENIESLGRIRAEAELKISYGQRAIEAITSVLVRPWSVFALLTCVVMWIAGNLYAAATGNVPIDPPPFFWLQGAVALYAAVVSTMVLVSQRRQSRDEERRDHLEFHVNLLAEQKATKIIALLEELRRDLPNVVDREDPVAEAMQEQVDPQLVHSALDPSP